MPPQNENATLSILLKARDQASRVIRNLGDVSKRAAEVSKRAFTGVGRSILRLVSTARRAFARIGSFARRLGGSIKRALTGNFLRLAATVSGVFAAFNAVQGASEFQTSLAEISTIVDTTQTDMAGLREEVLQLAIAFGQNENIVARGLYQTISSGITDAAEATEVLNISTQLAVAGLSEVDEAVNLLVGSLNAYGVGASEAQRFADLFFDTVERGRTTIPELAAGLGQVIPIAGQLGVSLEEVTAAVATLTRGGITTSESITALRGALIAFLRSADRAKGEFGEFSNVLGENAIQQKGLLQALLDVREATGGSADELQKLIGRAEAVNAILVLTGAGLEGFRGDLLAAGEAAGSLDVALGKRLDNAAFRVQRFGNAVRIAFGPKGFGESFLTAIDRGIEAAGGYEAVAEKIEIASRLIGEVLGSVVIEIGNAFDSLNTFFDEFFGGSQNVEEGVRVAFQLLGKEVDIFVKRVEIAAIRAKEALLQVFAGLPGSPIRFTDDVEDDIERVSRKIARLKKQFEDRPAQSVFVPDAGPSLIELRELEETLARLNRELESSALRDRGALSPAIIAAQAEIAGLQIEANKIVSDFNAYKEANEAAAFATDDTANSAKNLEERVNSLAGALQDVFASPFQEEGGGRNPFVDQLSLLIPLQDQIALTQRERIQLDQLALTLQEQQIKNSEEFLNLLPQQQDQILGLIEQAQTRLERAQKGIIDLQVLGADLISGATNALGSAFDSYITGAQSAGEAAKQFFRQLLLDLARSIFQMTVLNKLQSGLANLFGFNVVGPSLGQANANLGVTGVPSFNGDFGSSLGGSVTTGFRIGGLPGISNRTTSRQAAVDVGLGPLGPITAARFGLVGPNNPQLFVAGEGSRQEAFVPTIGGAIPVQMVGSQGAEGGGSVRNLQVHFHMEGIQDSQDVRRGVRDNMPTIINGLIEALQGKSRPLIDQVRRVTVTGAQ